MLRRYAPFVAIAIAIGLASVAIASDEGTIPQDKTPETCDEHGVKYHKAQAKGFARAIYAEKKWRDSTPAKPGQHEYFRWHIRCLYQPKADRALRAYKKHEKAIFYRYRSLRLVTNYHCGGKWKWAAVECYIVDCESDFNWGATNGSHFGWYQLSSEHNPPWPINSWKDKITHHRIADGLWGGPGDSDWKQCV